MPLLAEAEHTTIDGHGSSARTISEPNYSIGAGLGKSVGSFLLDSFRQYAPAPPWAALERRPPIVAVPHSNAA